MTCRPGHIEGQPLPEPIPEPEPMPALIHWLKHHAIETSSFKIAIWLIAGAILLAIVTSCNPYQGLQIATQTATARPVAAVATVTRSPTPSPMPAFVVNVDALTVRIGASENFQSVGHLRRGDRVRVYSTLEAPKEYCKVWARISYRLPYKWACYQFLVTGE